MSERQCGGFPILRGPMTTMALPSTEICFGHITADKKNYEYITDYIDCDDP